MKSRRTPVYAMWLVRWLSGSYRREALLGDLIEEFRRGRSRAWLWHQVFSALFVRLVASLQCGSLRRSWREYRSFLLFVLLMVGFRSAWADWMHVPSGSMNPTILEGDRILVDKHAYGLRVPLTLMRMTHGNDPQRGDIIVFESPEDGMTLVKRVVGVPGDTIALAGEQLMVNGAAAHYALGDEAMLSRLVRKTRAERPQVFEESGVAAVAHDILLLPDRWAPSFGPLVVPQSEYFVLGDNRDNSKDSRYIGLVPRRNILGRATRVVVSFDPDRYYLPRAGRVLEPLD